MLRSVILMAGFILIAVILIAPSLPTEDRLATSVEGRSADPSIDQPPAPPQPERVDRVFATEDSSNAKPERWSAPPPSSDNLVDLSPYDSPEARAAAAPES